ncbi:MAG: hypothetical protein RLZZ399_590 [Verrucomicrobiota bacterium]|jgi:DNA-binding transcriptional LysR family regulator
MSSEDRQYFKELRLQQFRGLLAVVKSGSFSLAASHLHLTKASVWQQVRALEEEFGCVLLETSGRKVKPTPQGLRLAQMAAPLVEGFDSIKAAFSADLEQTPATLSVATTPSCLAYELRNAVESTRSLFPDAHLTFHDRNSPSAIDLLESGEVDVAVAARFEEWPSKPSLEFLPLTTHPFTIAAPAGHPLLSGPSLELKDLARFPLLLPGPTANCRPRLEKLLRNAGIWEDLKVVLECSFPGSLLEYVDAGLGVTVTPVPSQLLRGMQDGLAPIPGRRTVLRDFRSALGEEPVFFIRRRGWIETPIATAFRRAALRLPLDGG